MIAKYPGTCGNCLNDFEPGTPIIRLNPPVLIRKRYRRDSLYATVDRPYYYREKELKYAHKECPNERSTES